MVGTKKDWSELVFPEDIHYHHQHAWIQAADNQLRVGITDYAQDQLGEIIFVELPSLGETFKMGEVFGQAESAKTVSSLHMPVNGKIAAVNNEIEDNPELVNQAPYAEGWLIMVEPEDTNELKQLLSKEDYIQLLGGQLT